MKYKNLTLFITYFFLINKILEIFVVLKTFYYILHVHLYNLYYNIILYNRIIFICQNYPIIISMQS